MKAVFILFVFCSPLLAVEKPNFLIILGEAQGWASMSVPLDDRYPEGSKSDLIRTPNLDSIALHGIRFSDFYAASPRCTPTRAALVTGRSPAALNMTFVNEGKKDGLVNPGDKVIQPTCTTELPAGIETMASLLKRSGYATAHFGKWHLGRANPREHGFDENDGANSNGGPENVEDPNPKQCYAIAEQGMDFMTRQVQAKKPFFLQLSQYPGRGPVTARVDTLEAVKKRLGTRMDFQRIGTAAGNEEIDKTIGLVLSKLKELGAMENTYILYTADHGAQGRNANGMLTNGKGTVWEGGLRVPLIVSGPGITAGQFSHVRASTVDLLPTVMELVGVSPEALPKNLEGVSLVNVLKRDPNAAPQRAHEELVIHFPHYDKDELGPASAILYQNWKMIRVFETEQRMLFDLPKDISEQHDLARTNPNVVLSLDNRMMDYLRTVNAQMPKPNPDYVEGGEKSGDRKGGKGGGGGGKKGKKGMIKEETGVKPTTN
ncbi:sulfatase-like hydrolase/transferase [Prosthecobacter sp.]|uniref:sulfatase-like hydrolase/transferase n=1 Tax=Prosthecobacter sp. TaxID=1965333 RepID=UPI001D7B1B42|nr:sulfatase-like hydrolase/transferase [Prosthecobacter sp.]MCB1274961.1 sulfatase-like hydrolase/transferase [Prosthecobacter sp.]